MIAASMTWPEASRDRYARHREKAYTLPDSNFPRLISRAIKRLPDLLRRMRPDWKIKTVKGQVARSLLTQHHRGLETRKARNQRRHTDTEVLRLLLSRVNVQPYSAEYSWLEIRRTSIEDICQSTGFSRSCVCDSLARLKSADLLRTKRNKNPSRDREWVATRWLTSAAFDMLGLAAWLEKQKQGNHTMRQQRDADRAALEALDVDLPAELAAQLERARRNAQNRPPPDNPKQREEETA